MLKISNQAVQQLVEYRNRRGPGACVRVGIMSGSTTGPALGITIDDKTEADEVFTFDSLEVVIDKQLLNFCESVTVDYVLQKGGGCGVGGGFRVTAKNRV